VSAARRPPLRPRRAAAGRPGAPAPAHRRRPAAAWPAPRRFFGTGFVCLSLTFFSLASMSDPGTVTAANAEAHRALYPYDDAIWATKECWTCKLERPARSKHCAVCARCGAVRQRQPAARGRACLPMLTHARRRRRRAAGACRASTTTAAGSTRAWAS
jgi:hypothetical protein